MTQTPPPQQQRFSLKDVSVQFDDAIGLDKINFSANSNDFITIVGPNGAGKSTLLRVIAGVLPPSSGSIDYDKSTRIGYVPQTIHLNPALPLRVRDFFELSADFSLESTGSPELPALLGEFHETYTQIADKQMVSLSVGELQSVLLQRSLLAKPNVLILDEPEQSLDYTRRVELYRKLETIHATGVTIVVASHNLNIVMTVSTCVVCLNKHICCLGAPTDMAQEPDFKKIFGSAASGHLSPYWHEHDHDHA